MALKDVDDLIKKSGHSFHAKVARWFISKGWNIIVSPYYMDQTQRKAREIDLISYKNFEINCERKKTYCNVLFCLYVECKYIDSTSVFWFSGKDKELAKKLVCNNTFFRENNIKIDDHHYLCGDQVAKIFETFNNKRERDPFYNAINQVLNGFVSMKGRVNFKKNKKDHYKTYKLEFPVIVCNEFNNIYSVPFEIEDFSKKEIKDNFQIEINYSYLDYDKNSHSDYFLIDIVEYNQLGNFVQSLYKDFDIAKFFIIPT